MSKVMVSFRLEDRLRDKLKVWAMEDHRTVSNCVESLLSQEERRREGGEVTLWSLDQKLDRLLSEKKEKKAKKNDETKFNPYTIDLPDFISREIWVKWVNHLKSQNRKLNEEAALAHIEALVDAYEKGWEIEHVINRMITKLWVNIYLEKD